MRAAILCALWGLTFAKRAEMKGASSWFPNLDASMLGIGGKGGHLIPGLMPPPGCSYTFGILENRSFFQRNDYSFTLSKVCQGNMCEMLKEEGPFMHAKGSWRSNTFGRRTVNIFANSGNPIFQVRQAKLVFNPLRIRQSFRVSPPNNSNVSDVLFTINRDIFGQGFLWMKDEWRIYRGQKKHNDQVYFAIGGYLESWSSTEIYKIPGSDYQQHPDKRVGTIKKKLNSKTVVGDVLGVGDWMGDRFIVEVKEGEDSALLLAFGMITDMFHDAVESNRGG
eukprot:TRINITY_DN27522_c0_g1_i1.p1 TRINITY_DN27522_c0_g1~~TRINITY_DN27522_c0_g1_i1.p1  ORF type:complete len:298 (+),score=32.80 TRINITY_DN27522_c0_g1_i1:58-894(+)